MIVKMRKRIGKRKRSDASRPASDINDVNVRTYQTCVLLLIFMTFILSRIDLCQARFRANSQILKTWRRPFKQRKKSTYAKLYSR